MIWSKHSINIVKEKESLIFSIHKYLLSSCMVIGGTLEETRDVQPREDITWGV